MVTHYLHVVTVIQCAAGAVVSSCVVDAATGRELLMISMDPDRPVNRTAIHADVDVQQLDQDFDQVRTCINALFYRLIVFQFFCERVQRVHITT
jgi:hypothetical protein